MEITFDLLLEIKTKTGAFKEIFLERKKKETLYPVSLTKFTYTLAPGKQC